LETATKLDPFYFYVPKGTKQIAYYVEGSAHQLYDGTGRLAARVQKQPGNVILVPVPAGQDGQAWHLDGLKQHCLWFFNCPNYLAARAESLLVPREALTP
jgi:hypothetical protein